MQKSCDTCLVTLPTADKRLPICWSSLVEDHSLFGNAVRPQLSFSSDMTSAAAESCSDFMLKFLKCSEHWLHGVVTVYHSFCLSVVPFSVNPMYLPL